jgi:hypothetical protein
MIEFSRIQPYFFVGWSAVAMELNSRPGFSPWFLSSGTNRCVIVLWKNPKHASPRFLSPGTTSYISDLEKTICIRFFAMVPVFRNQ